MWSALAVVLIISSLRMISSTKNLAKNSPQISELESILCNTNVEFILYWNQRFTDTDEPVRFPAQLTCTIILLTEQLNIPHHFGNRLSKLIKQQPVNVLALTNEFSVETTNEHIRYEIYALRFENSHRTTTFSIHGKYLIAHYQVFLKSVENLWVPSVIRYSNFLQDAKLPSELEQVCEKFPNCFNSFKTKVDYFTGKNQTFAQNGLICGNKTKDLINFSEIRKMRKKLIENVRFYNKWIRFHNLKLLPNVSFPVNLEYQLLLPDLPLISKKCGSNGLVMKEWNYWLFLSSISLTFYRRDEQIQGKDSTLLMYTLDIDNFNFITCHSSHSDISFRIYIDYFGKHVWLLLFSSIAVLWACICFVLHRCHHVKLTISVFDTFLLVIGPLLNICVPDIRIVLDGKRKNEITTKFLYRIIGIWFLLTVVVSLMYQIIVISHVIKPKVMSSSWSQIDELTEFKIFTPLFEDNPSIEQLDDSTIDQNYNSTERYVYFAKGTFLKHIYMTKEQPTALLNATKMTLITIAHSAFGFVLYHQNNANLIYSLKPTVFGEDWSKISKKLGKCDEKVAYVSTEENINKLLEYSSRVSSIGAKFFKGSSSRYQKRDNWYFFRTVRKNIYTYRLKCLLESGVYSYLKSLAVNFGTKTTSKTPNKTVSINLSNSNISSIFIVYLYCCGIAIAVWIVAFALRKKLAC